MSKKPMTYQERAIYNEAQALYLKAQQTRDKANAMYNDRMKAEAEEAKSKSAKAEEDRKLAMRQKFSNQINNICVALGEACKKEGVQIYGGELYSRTEPNEKLIFTVHSSFIFPRLSADVYAVANKGFRWEIKS